MKITRIEAPSDLETALARISTTSTGTNHNDEQEPPVFLLFFGTEDPNTNESWCSDCVIADPAIRKYLLSNAPSCQLFECPVGTRSEWKSEELRAKHVYHVKYGVNKVPTLIRWVDGKETGRCVEDECLEPAILNAKLLSKK